MADRVHQAQIKQHRSKKSTIEAFFDAAELNPNASSIKGVICGYRVEEIKNPLTQKARYMDKLVDERMNWPGERRWRASCGRRATLALEL